ncbi:hypothetical protein [Leifsonia sp. Leaf264]|uniref:hypothetical protein n=1 Tax=Leifsonia sp. Leaf264 TaxID=1736314 RepID=UPI0006F5699C|nr:hypothetical protein [Leifsonia sp. Leaf264]KQO96814.1 hypothetical protein ASF30_17160 [Leifsonia sp. Leaf264]
MTKQEFIEKMTKLGYSEPQALNQIFVAADPDSLTGAPYNVVERSAGEFVIYEPDGRGGYSLAMVALGRPFLGRSLEDAYSYVHNEIAEARRIYGVRR